MNEFDIKAKEWDSNPMHWERSTAIAEIIKAHVQPNPNIKALEYGAGTGILSFLLKDIFTEITLMDNSIEMIHEIERKIERVGAIHMKAKFSNLEENKAPDEKYDVIFLQMVLHHVSNYESLLIKFHNMLSKDGFLFIADLYSEDGTFHDKTFTGHKGFDVNILSKILEKNNFQNIYSQKCFTIKRITESNRVKEYPVFLLSANAN